MHKLFLAVFTAGAMLCGAAHAAATYSDLAAWQAAAGSYSRDTDYGADSTLIDSLTLDDGTQLSFGKAVRIRTVGLSWTSWSGGYTDQVLYSNGWASLTIDFASPVTGFGFFTEPRVFAVYTINMLLSDGSSVSGDYDGASGAGFLGFLGEGVTSATISSADDFAIGDFYTTVAAGAVPEPAAWAMMIAGFGLVGASLRRRKPLIGAV